MRRARVFLVLLSIALASCATVLGAGPPQDTGPPNADLLSLGVDSRSPIESRIGKVPAEVVDHVYLESFTAPGGGTSKAGRLPTADERRKFLAAVAALTPLQRRVVQEHLRSISFVDGLGANATTLRVNCKATCLAFDLILNTKVLGETVSEFATRKERMLFDTAGSPLTVSVDAGKMDAIVFVLLHESTHMVDAVFHLTPEVAPGYAIPDASQTPYSRGVWEESMKSAAVYRTTLLDGIFWRSGKKLGVDKAQALYEDLKKTPFASVFASTNPGDDLADFVALWRLTEKYHQPYRIEIRDGAKVVYSYEPMKNALVRSRLPQLARFDSPDIE